MPAHRDLCSSRDWGGSDDTPRSGILEAVPLQRTPGAPHAGQAALATRDAPLCLWEQFRAVRWNPALVLHEHSHRESLWEC